MAMIPSARSRLSQYRTRHGWSQADLAEKSTVSRTEISAIETGRVVPSVAVALRLAATLGESVEALFGGPAAATAETAWAWPPVVADDPRLWRATVNGKVLAYPVEPTAAGFLPHDSMATPQGTDVGSDVRPERTLVIAGCDPLVGLLVHEMAERHGVRVIPLLRSSAAALELLRQGVVHAAGIHLANDDQAIANDEIVRSRLGAGYCLLHQVRWETGVALASRQRESRVRDLLRADLRWVNRDEGSAARGVLDRLLGRRPRPNGYRQVVHDHRAVATAISGGWAEAGICIRATAAEQHLGFVPVQHDAYELCLPESKMADPRMVALTTTLRSPRYRQWLGDVPGCVARHTGEQRIVA